MGTYDSSTAYTTLNIKIFKDDVIDRQRQSEKLGIEKRVLLRLKLINDFDSKTNIYGLKDLMKYSLYPILDIIHMRMQ